jgi:hypothetical protein
MLKHLPIPVIPTPRAPLQRMKQQVLHEEASVKRELITLAQAAPMLGIKHSTLDNLSKHVMQTYAFITMPDGSKERLEIVRQNRLKMVDIEGVKALAHKSALIKRSRVRIRSFMEAVGITGSTMRRHLVREDGQLFFELPSPAGRKRFEVTETSSTAKSMGVDDVVQIKRLFALMHGKLPYEELAKDFNPKNTYTIHETALLTGLGQCRIANMINRGTLKARKSGGRWLIKGLAIEKHFEEHMAAPTGLIRMMKAAKILGHESRWITRRLVSRDGRETLIYRDEGISIPIRVYRMNDQRAFSLSDLHGLKLIIENISLRGYLDVHWRRYAEMIHESVSSSRAIHSLSFSTCGQRIEERTFRLILEYNFPHYDIRVIKVGDALLVSPEDAQAIALSILLHGSDRGKLAAISELEGMETIPERHYWIVRGAFLSTFGPLVKRLGAIMTNHDARRPVNPFGMVARAIGSE